MHPKNLPGGGYWKGDFEYTPPRHYEGPTTVKGSFRKEAMRIADTLWQLDMKAEAILVIRAAFGVSILGAYVKMANAWTLDQDMIDTGIHGLYLFNCNKYGNEFPAGSKPACTCKPCQQELAGQAKEQ